MGVLQRFERRLEGLVSHAFTRVFKGQVEPVEVAAQLQRETDDRKAVVGEGRILVPNDFVVELGGTDFDRLSPYARPLGAELADMVSEHAAEQGYSFVGPVRVTLERAEDLDTGRFLIRSGVAAGDGPAGAGASQSEPPPPVTPAALQQVANWTGPAVAQGGSSAAGGLSLEVNSPTGEQRSVALTRPVTRIGRGADCELRLEDTGVSRRHAEIRIGPDGATITDLGSTNGTSVNGKRVASTQLSDGDHVAIGETALVFRRGGGGQ